MLNLESGLRCLKGIGRKREQAFAKLGIRTIEDILTFFPSRYQDRTKIVSIKNAYKQSQSCCIFGKVGKVYERIFTKGLCLLDIEVFDNTCMTHVRFFRKRRMYSSTDIFASVKRIFKSGVFAYIYGEVKIKSNDSFMLVNDYEIVEKDSDVPLFFNKIVPIYATTKKMSQTYIRVCIHDVLRAYFYNYPDVSELLPVCNWILKMSAPIALKKIHYPDSLKDAENARRSFALQEFFVLESALYLLRNKFKKNLKEQKYEIKYDLLKRLEQNLKFEFTSDQQKAIKDIFTDMQSEYPMNRILIGDVGCGKTVVALSAMLLAIENGYQAMIIAPSEILAEQHYRTILNLLSGVSVKIALLTSSSLKKRGKRKIILEGLESNNIQIAIGTHALVEDRIKFASLSFIVIDEQHKFGVMQKSALLKKASYPDVLVMSATPIPRALSMIMYGEMDVTTIKQLPPGRIPVITYVLDEIDAYQKTIEELKNGNQVYIVYPLIDDSEELDLKSVLQESRILSQTWFRNFKVGLFHGQLKSAKKDEILTKFKSKEIDVLISTTIIEVGIDVPNATVMIIQHVERFGLAQLHQLRGRIGRSNKQSYLYLIQKSKGESADKRVKIIESTNDGFEIAEADLKMRGPGELMGIIQHGFSKFKAGDIIKDEDIIEYAKSCAKKIIDDDPTLSKEKNFVLKKLVSKRFCDKRDFTNVC
ncbi:MAG: ATP-dependent DNA helicase RecG [Endomicrobium sp.]|jgi:ATP-dependent DNA helicase RecG|nr:ATP-dependent DNA helicase RecG [Endomicrobium sp.]